MRRLLLATLPVVMIALVGCGSEAEDLTGTENGLSKRGDEQPGKPGEKPPGDPGDDPGCTKPGEPGPNDPPLTLCPKEKCADQGIPAIGCDGEMDLACVFEPRKGVCYWQITCESKPPHDPWECRPDECGPEPTAAICQDGTAPLSRCVRDLLSEPSVVNSNEGSTEPGGGGSEDGKGSTEPGGGGSDGDEGSTEPGGEGSGNVVSPSPGRCFWMTLSCGETRPEPSPGDEPTSSDGQK